MKLTDALRGEHGVFAALFESLEQIALRGPPPAELSAVLVTTAAVLVTHTRMEEELLLPALLRAGLRIPALAVVREQHREMEDLIERVRHAPDSDAASRALLTLLHMCRAHFTAEEERLFPLADAEIPEVALHRLGAEWASLRGVALEPAYVSQRESEG